MPHAPNKPGCESGSRPRSAVNASRCPGRAAARAGRRVVADLLDAVAVAKDVLGPSRPLGGCLTGPTESGKALNKELDKPCALEIPSELASRASGGSMVSKDAKTLEFAAASHVRAMQVLEAENSTPEEDVVLIAQQQLLEWDRMKEQLGLLKGQPLSVHQMEEILKVLADLEGSDDQNLKQASDHSCSTQTSVASMGASLPCSESDAEEPNVHPRTDHVRPKFQAKSISKRLEIPDRLYTRVTRRYSQSRDLTIRVGSPRSAWRI